MTSTPRQQLKLLQRSLYEKAYEEANSLAAISSPKIIRYSKQFESSLPLAFEKTNQADVLEAAREANVIVYGDFHTLRQSQRGFLRILRAYQQRYKTKKMALFLEVFRHQDQHYLDAYMADEISQEELLKLTNYSRDWGFPWLNYKMLLEFAKEHKLPVFGINSDNAGRDSLSVRDRFAADILVKYASAHKDHRLFCLVGEYHLADEFLPKQLERASVGNESLSLIRIVNNVDKYYFQLESSPRAMTTEYLRLSKNFYCVINSPPWIKWHSVTVWDEMRGMYSAQATEEFLDDDLDDYSYTETAFDIDYQFLTIIKNVMGFLKLRVDERALDHFTVHTFPDDGLFEELQDRYQFTDAELSFIIERVTRDGLFLVVEGGLILLTRFTLNNMAESAGQYMQHSRRSDEFEAGDLCVTFYRRVLQAAAGMVASLVMNPRRKAHDIYYHRRLVNFYGGRKLQSIKRERRDLSKLILDHHNWLRTCRWEEYDQFEHRMASLLRKEKASYGECSRAIGNMLGATLYKKFLTHQTDNASLQSLFNSDLGQSAVVWKLVLDLYSQMDP